MDLFEEIRIWGAPCTRAVRADEAAENVSPDLELFALKGETESGQFILTSFRDFTVAEFNLRATDLTSTDGKRRIAAKNISFYLQKYVRICNPSWEAAPERTAPMREGLYPDALIPFGKAAKRCENILNRKENQGIWVNVKVPASAVGGLYTGKIIVSIGTADREINVRLRVFSPKMPRAVHEHTCYQVWYDLIRRGERCEESLKMEEKYYEFLLKRRINSGHLPTAAYHNPEEYAEYVVRLAKDERVTDYKIPSVVVCKEDGRLVVDSESAVSYLTALAEKQKELRAAGDDADLFRKAFWYSIDEPDYAIDGKDHMADVAPTEKAFVRAKEEAAKAYPEFADSIRKVAHVMVTQQPHPECAGSDADGGIQTWCSQVHNFASDKKYEIGGRELTAREFVRNRKSNPEGKAAGQKVWWYHCNMPLNPYPTCMIDDNLIAMRLLPWAQYSLGIQGVLGWCVNYYQKYSEIGITGRNVWRDAVVMGRSNGDGAVLYPGVDYGVFGPISTLRLETMGRSMQDYEYFWLLDQKFQEINQKFGTGYDAQELCTELLKPLMKEDVIPLIDGGRENEVFLMQRKRILELLEFVYSAKYSLAELDEMIEKTVGTV